MFICFFFSSPKLDIFTCFNINNYCSSKTCLLFELTQKPKHAKDTEQNYNQDFYKIPLLDIIKYFQIIYIFIIYSDGN